MQKGDAKIMFFLSRIKTGSNYPVSVRCYMLYNSLYTFAEIIKLSTTLLIYICTMLTPSDLEARLRSLKPMLSTRFYVERIGYFGSFARNEQDENSDIDILVEFAKPLGWEFFDLKDLLEAELNNKVDLVSIKALKSQLKDSILSQVKFL